MELHPYEEWLIERLRGQYKFSEVVVKVQDGLPVMIKQVVLNDKPPKIHDGQKILRGKAK